LPLQLGSNCLHLCIGLFQGDAVVEAGDALKVMTAAPQSALANCLQRRPKFGAPAEGKLEAAR
jgi:hypothetical protein